MHSEMWCLGIRLSPSAACGLPHAAVHSPTSAHVVPARLHRDRGLQMAFVTNGTGATSTPSITTKPVTLVSFDVDGTLMESIGDRSNQLHKQSFAHAFKAVFGADTHIDVVQHHGSTDLLICIKVLVHYGIPKDQVIAKLPELQAAMTDFYLQHEVRAGEGLRMLPGVKELLTALKARDDVQTCLVTGNLQPIGWAKMRSLGLEGLFTEPRFGGFGSDFCSGDTEETWRDRAEFVRIAARRCEERCSGGIAARFHVGDTPMDVQAAVEAGAAPVGVTTGIFSRQQLEAAAGSHPVVVLEDLTDVEGVMAVFGLK